MRRRRLLMRAVPLAVISTGAFAAGVVVSSGSGELDAVTRFGDAWARGDFDAMHAELTPAAQDAYPVAKLERSYVEAEQVATTDAITVGEARGPLDSDGERVVALAVSAPTASFGTVEGEIGIPVDDEGIGWRPDLVFPGLNEGEALGRKMKLPSRAPIVAADRSRLAEGPADARTTSGAGGIIAGELGTPKGAQAAARKAAGFPRDVPAGTSGLELAFDSELAGTPGGKLLAVGGGETRVIAQGAPSAGKPLRTTIDPTLQDATAAALGDAYGGAALLDASNGDVLALAGLAFSAPQPPGSTFKVITVTGVIDSGIAKLDDEFPVVSSATVGGREIGNAHDELCGGTLVESFAESCNSVFAPLGEQLGGSELVKGAELFGFNAPPPLYEADALALVAPPESSIPADLTDAEAGVSAIGQGEVLATPLQMASVAQTIANRGVRSPTSLIADPELAGDYPDVSVTTPRVAKDVRKMMVDVVAEGTGTAAALPDATVAGKTGTAELGTTSGEPIGDAPPEADVDAWFTAFAPADKPKYAVAVMVVNADGDGGVIAAPIARAILEAAL